MKYAVLDVPTGSRHHPFEPFAHRFFVVKTGGAVISRLAERREDVDCEEVLYAFSRGYTQLWIMERVRLLLPAGRFAYPQAEPGGGYYVIGDDGTWLHPRGNLNATRFDTIAAAEDAARGLDGARARVVAKRHADIYWH